MIRTAQLSEDRTCRYELAREFEPGDDLYDPVQCGSVLFVLNNPSVADELHDDPTLRRGMAYASVWGYRKLYFGNTNPWRSTLPELAKVPDSERLALNDLVLARLAEESEIVIAAWGMKANPMLVRRAVGVLRRVKPIHMLALSTEHDTPKHILYLKASLLPQLWRPKR